jgi:hypothetical protein
MTYMHGGFYGLRRKGELGGISALDFGMRVLPDGPRALEQRWIALASRSVLIGMLLVQVVYMIVVAAVSRKEPRDERTRLIEYKGYKVAYLAVEAVLSGWLLWLYLPQHWNEPHKKLPLLLAVWLGVEAIRMGTQLVLYWASVRA